MQGVSSLLQVALPFAKGLQHLRHQLLGWQFALLVEGDDARGDRLVVRVFPVLLRDQPRHQRLVLFLATRILFGGGNGTPVEALRHLMREEIAPILRGQNALWLDLLGLVVLVVRDLDAVPLLLLLLPLGDRHGCGGGGVTRCERARSS